MQTTNQPHTRTGAELQPPFPAYLRDEPFVFVSYAHVDKAQVYPEIKRLHDFGSRIWYDGGIPPGKDWPATIERTIRRCELFLVFVSPRAFASENVKDELHIAFEAQKPILAIHLEHTDLPDGYARMSRFQAIHKYEYEKDEHIYWDKVDQGLPNCLREMRPQPSEAAKHLESHTTGLGTRVSPNATQDGHSGSQHPTVTTLPLPSPFTRMWYTCKKLACSIPLGGWKSWLPLRWCVPASVLVLSTIYLIETGSVAALLGDAYRKGYVVAKNYSQSASWYAIAANLGHARSQYELGACYYYGEGVLQNLDEAVKWYRKAADQGNAAGQCNLGWCYDHGEGVPNDETQAVKWYRKAADKGYAPAQFHLGVWYAKGGGLVLDTREAVNWYRKAADQGHAGGQCNLGWCYDHGEGVPEDKTQAVKWYRKAADQGLGRAQYLLGLCYFFGEGVSKNKTEAEKWFRKVAEQGHQPAKEKLSKLNR
ncbi:MAG: toll/interleukin-1 receptor domain-containing protein [Thermodesulfobacteriota bacterium]